MAKKKQDPIIIPAQEAILSDMIYGEYTTAKSNNTLPDMDFEAVIDLLECRRTEKNYDWMSDVFIPEYPSILNTEASQWVNQYFQSRDFVDVYLEGDKPDDTVKCSVVKKLLNKTLNRPGLHHFQKYVRTRTINSIGGVCWVVCGWEQELKQVKVGTYRTPKQPTIADDGTLIPQYDERDVQDTQVLKDHFTYEVVDPRNVFTDNTYSYSAQDKNYIIVRSEQSYEDLLKKEKSEQYFNLDKLKEIKALEETETSKGTYNKDDKTRKPPKPQTAPYDILRRYGKAWAVVKDVKEDGTPKNIVYGYDEFGDKKENAELIEAIVTMVLCGSYKIMIGFRPTPFVSSVGLPYRPLVRGLCYVHPTKDVGMSDGKYSRELSVAINDIINISNDRVKLATFPTFKGVKYSLDDNDQVFIEPEHVIPLENVDDLQELQIRDNVRGALDQAGLFINKLQQVNSVFPSTMGDLPGKASTTATAVAGADTRSNLRANYKALTVEYTFLTEFYWMILQMSYQFMNPKTAFIILGEEMKAFDPDSDYVYQPVTANIELEYNKRNKLQTYDQLLGRISGIKNPAVVPIIAHVLSRMMVLLGDEFQTIAPMIKKLAVTPNQEEGGGEQPKDMKDVMTSNQQGYPMSAQEMSTRGV